jgi:hypothetical protein
MKHACYKWTALIAALAAALLVSYWTTSLLYDDVDLYLVFGNRVHVKAADGVLTFCDHVANLEVIKIIDTGGLFEPKPTRSVGSNLPWLGFRYLGFGDGSPIWSLHASLLIPCICLGLFSVLAFRGMRRMSVASRTT